MAVSVTDIANRALQRVGAKLINTQSNNTLYTDTGNNANQVRAAYDILRRAELRRNVWRFAIRRTALRALDTTTMIFVPLPYNPATTYARNAITSYGGIIYQSAVSANTGNQPDQSQSFWNIYIGPVTAEKFDPTANPPTQYYAGELVYDNSNVVYMSLLNGNVDTPPSANWLTLTGATLDIPNIIYPVGTGPVTQQATRNVFFLPSGFLKEAPQDPTAGNVSFLGFPANLMMNDWTFENDYIISRDSTAIAFRFSSDLVNPMKFDPMFVEGFASRLAFELAEPLTQSTGKLQAIGAEYKQFMGEARMTNGIETGSTQPPLDDFLAARI